MILSNWKNEGQKRKDRKRYMIYTITFNPALDYTTQVENFEIGKINRTKTENILAGGKGLNVSIILKRLGIDNIAFSFIAGFTGKELERIINEYDITTDFIEVNKGYTRINVKISSIEKNSLFQESETALNGNGPEITSTDIERLLKKIQKINSNDMVILSGNIPKCINEDIYEIICKELNKNKVKFVVDASQSLLTNCLKYKPFFIKPNKDELEETFNVKITTKEQIIIYAKKLQEKGAQNVLISLGGNGAILITEKNEVYYSNTPKGQVINTVGAGDSMVAGFVAGYLKTQDFKNALKFGVASGSATAFSAGLALKEEIDELLKQITIEKI